MTITTLHPGEHLTISTHLERFEIYPSENFTSDATQLNNTDFCSEDNLKIGTGTCPLLFICNSLLEKMTGKSNLDFFLCLLSSLGHSILYSRFSQKHSSLYAPHRGCGAKEDPSNMATPKIYSSCASCDEHRKNLAYYEGHANYHPNELFR